MAHDLSFADAAKQSPATILRLPLLPYSIGHEILLISQRNPLLFDRAEFDRLKASQQIAALMRAVSVCSRSWRQNQRPERNLRLWSWSIRKSNWPAEIAEFRNYRASGSDAPPPPTRMADEIVNGKRDDEGGRDLGGSYLGRALAFACKHYAALDYETAWDFPIGLCLHMHFGELELAGNVRIANAKELEVEAELKAHQQSAEKEKRCPD